MQKLHTTKRIGGFIKLFPITASKKKDCIYVSDEIGHLIRVEFCKVTKKIKGIVLDGIYIWDGLNEKASKNRKLF